MADIVARLDVSYRPLRGLLVIIPSPPNDNLSFFAHVQGAASFEEMFRRHRQFTVHRRP